MRKSLTRLPVVVCAAIMVFNGAPASAQTAPSLGAAQSFGVLGGTASVTNTGPTVVNGDLGDSSGAGIGGFNAPSAPAGPGTFTGGFHNGDILAGQAQLDAISRPVTSALNNMQGQPCLDTSGAVTVGTTTFGPGVHCWTSTLISTPGLNTWTLDGQNNPNAVFIFKVGSDMTFNSNLVIQLINGAQACNVFWAVRGTATVGTSVTAVGNILAGTSITMNTNARLFGRVLAGASVTLDSNTIDATVCAGVAAGPSGACVSGATAPTITAIPSQVIPVLPVGGSVAVGFTIAGPVITDALVVRSTSSDTTLVPGSAMTITKGAGGARVLTIFGADGRSGVTTITVSVTDPTNPNCVTTRSFQLTIGPVAVPTLPQWAFIMMALLLAGAGMFSVRRSHGSGRAR